MEPLLHPGDVVVVEPVQPNKLYRGDVIVVQRRGELITHRLVGMDHDGWRTKGDHDPYFDAPVPAQAILGRVIAIERNGTRVDLQTRCWRAVNRWLGRLGWWEAWLFQTGQRVRAGLLGTPLYSWPPVLAALLLLPFRIVTWGFLLVMREQENRQIREAIHHIKVVVPRRFK
jgi:signal peptidase I